MQLGFNKTRIKLVNNKLCGQFQNGELQHSDYSPPLPQTTSTLESSSTASVSNQWLSNCYYINIRSIINKLFQFQTFIYSHHFDNTAITLIKSIYNMRTYPSKMANRFLCRHRLILCKVVQHCISVGQFCDGVSQWPRESCGWLHCS